MLSESKHTHANVSFHVGKIGASLGWAGVSWFTLAVYVATASVLVIILFMNYLWVVHGGGGLDLSR